ncbi:hypothetical protein [Gemmatimonas groenlandica]|uniref:Uncharacterized protein n=1 Tax=Gemmatimonas groenlandica TaxID=2732249 RepID=A0A6M4ILU5_9BACT|nr:hypothetical protein [Gemmatimonas groenlandica]QJR35640.1 hypothetical protein HKW67_09015 [Gemmatimonas groenlandica]
MIAMLALLPAPLANDALYTQFDTSLIDVIVWAFATLDNVSARAETARKLFMQCPVEGGQDQAVRAMDNARKGQGEEKLSN